MRLLVALVLFAPAAWAQDDPDGLRGSVTTGIGVAMSGEDGLLAFHGSLGLRRGVATGRLRITRGDALFGGTSAWDVAALGGATFDGPTGQLFVGAGPGLAGGSDGSGCPLLDIGTFPCERTDGRRRVRPGLAVGAEAHVRVREGVLVGMQGFSTVAGGRTTTGLALGLTFGG